jgi:succinate dehydrogenase / fumarate reductase iron-sulfur subunit
MKERVVDRKYDPLVWLGRKIFKRQDLEQRGATGATSLDDAGPDNGSALEADRISHIEQRGAAQA